MQTSEENKINYDEALAIQQAKNEARRKYILAAKRKWYIYQFKKWAKITLISVATILVLWFPRQSGQVIGVWMHDFFGTIMKESIR